MSTVIKASRKKVVKSSTSTSAVTTSFFTFQVNKIYPTIKAVAVACNAVYKPRRGFMRLSPQGRNLNAAIWCIKLNDTSIPWENTMDSTGRIIKERRRKDLNAVDFYKRVTKGAPSDIDQLRLTFVKETKGYRFVGVFRVACFDFKNRQVIYEKVEIPELVIKITTKRIVTIEIEESVEVVVF